MRVVDRDSVAYPTLNFEEHYVHAIQKALEGRDNRPLLELLRKRRTLHPVLLPALADVIESQRDRAVGSGARLTARDDQSIRFAFDNFVGPWKKVRVLEELQKSLNVSEDTLVRSLRRTEPAK